MDRVNRRTFLFGAAAAAGLPGTMRAARAPSRDRVRLGIIGVGGQGAYSWRSLADEEVVMLCDVDLARTAEAARRFPKAEVVQDFRRVIERKDIDAVAVCTPDHWHAIPSIWAMQAGKHVYCEKPLARTVHETRAMVDAAKKYRRVTQMGTQIHAGSNYRRVVELIQAGAIGPVRRVDVWCNRRPEPGKRAAPGGPASGSPPPPTLDYELWIGPAEMRPYDPAVVPFHWRWWWEFGGGVLADMGCHFMDLAHWALGLRHVERVSAAGTEFPDADNKVPVEMRVDFHYPERPSMPPVQLTWWHGNPGPKDESGRVVDYGMPSAVLFHGEKGQLVSDYGSHRLLPEEKFRDYPRPRASIPESPGHHREWIQAIKNGGRPLCEFAYAGPLTETVLLGNVAYRCGQEIAWDPKKGAVTNAKEAARYLQPHYRGSWKLGR